MLKITVHLDERSTTLQLEGRLVGPWVGELERSWTSAMSGRADRSLLVDLSAVTFVDEQGKDLLKRLHSNGAQFTASGCLTTCIVEEIMRGDGGPKRTKRAINP